MANEPHKAKGKTQGRKWKLQVCATKIERGGTNGPINVKRPNSKVVWPSPENKKMRVSSPIKQIQKAINLSPPKQAYNHIEHSPHRAPRRLKLTNEELRGNGRGFIGRSWLLASPKAMRILSWNVRGLRKPRTRVTIKKFSNYIGPKYFFTVKLK